MLKLPFGLIFAWILCERLIFFHVFRYTLITILLSISCLAYSQESYGPRTDSLLNLARNATRDVADSLYMEAGRSLAYVRPVDAIGLLNKALDLAERNENHKIMCMAHSFIGIAYNRMGSLNMAVEYYNNQLNIAKQYGIDDEVAWANNNIGLLLLHLRNLEFANIYLQEAKELAEQIGDDYMLQYVYSNIGWYKLEMEEYDSSVCYFNMALDIRMKPPVDNIVVAASYRDLGNVYFAQHSYAEAKYYYGLSNTWVDTITSDMSAAINVNMARIYIDEHKPDSALYCAHKAVGCARRFVDRMVLRDAFGVMGSIYYQQGKYEDANHCYNSQILYQDSVKLTNLTDKIYNLQYQKQVADQKDNIRMAQEHTQQYGIVALVVIALVIGGMYFHFRLRSKRRQIIKINNAISEHNVQIDKSMAYAKKIQMAVIPDFDKVNITVPNKFLLFKPKHEVSGNFYWAQNKGSVRMLAICDSGEAGVPGAFMSMLCSSMLFDVSTHENDPAKILTLLREKMLQVIRKYSFTTATANGVDISLLVMDLRNTMLYYSGVKFPMLMIRDGVANLVQDNDESASFYDTDFQTSAVEANPGDSIYIMTHGLSLQKNPDGQELSRERLFSYILSISQQPMKTQKALILSFFDQWRGDVAQQRDLLMAGGVYPNKFRTL